jgi:hypothetical protein
MGERRPVQMAKTLDEAMIPDIQSRTPLIELAAPGSLASPSCKLDHVGLSDCPRSEVR